MKNLACALILLFGFCSVSAGVPSVFVYVNEGDPVTLDTDVKADPEETFKWFYNNSLIAKLDVNYTDVQHNNKTERFKDRLKLDHQTGSLTITNTRTTDSGEYHLDVIKSNKDSDKSFIVSVHVSVVDRGEVKRVSVKEGESVTLDLGGIRNTSDVMSWYFNDIRIAKISEDKIQICTFDECKERFSDRLKVDNQTGSLNITNFTNTDSGEYKLQISNRISVSKSFQVDVAAPYSGQPSGIWTCVVVGVVVGVVGVVVGGVVVGVVGWIYIRKCSAGRNGNAGGQRNQENAQQPAEHEEDVPLNQIPPAPDNENQQPQ